MDDEYEEQKTTVKHIIVSWDVKNFSISNERAYCLRTAPFCVHGSSRFYLGLEWNPDQFNCNLQDKYILIHLLRRKEECLNSIRVSLRFGYESDKNVTKWCESHLNGFIGAGLIQSEMIRLEPKLPLSPMRFLCEFIVYIDQKEKLGVLRQSYRRSLREIPIYWEGSTIAENYLDYTIALLEYNLPANKNVLCRRSPILREMIQKATGDTLHLSMPDDIGMEQLLFYLHLNNLDFYNDAYLSFDLYDLSVLFKVDELTEKLQPKMIKLFSKAGGIESSFVWKVKDVSSIIPNEYLRSPNISPNSKLTCCLKLTQNKKDLRFFVQLSNNQTHCDINIIISFGNNLGEWTGHRSLTFPDTSVLLLRDIKSFFLKTKEYEKYLLPENTLTIQLQISLSDVKFISKVEAVEDCGQCHLVPECFPNENGEPDLCITTKQGGFDVHKNFLNFRMQGYDGNLLKIIGFKPNILRLILEFIYTGKLYANDLSTVGFVYGYAISLKIHFLTDICSHYFKHQINNSCAHSIFLLATQHDDTNLARRALDHLCQNAPLLMISKEFQKFASDNPNLQRKIAQTLSKAYLIAWNMQQGHTIN